MPIDGDALAGQVDGVVPAGGVEERAAEGLDALDLGQPRLGEAAGRGDEGPGGDLAGRRTDLPALRRRRPRRRARARCRRRCAPVTPYSLGDALEVGLDLGLRGVRRRPVGVAGEGERVELAGDVAARAGVGVVAPGAADVVGLLDDHEVGLAVLGELDRCAEAGEAGPDDQVVDVRGQGRLRPWGDAIRSRSCRVVRDVPVGSAGGPTNCRTTESAGGQVVDGDAVDGLGGEGVLDPGTDLGRGAAAGTESRRRRTRRCPGR